MTQHTVESGDTLSSIARDYGFSLAEIVEANPQIGNVHRIRPGDIVNVPRVNAPQSSEARPVQDSCQRCHWIRMEFNGSTLSIFDDESNELIRTFPAVSGLPPGAPRVRQLIAQGRSELKVGTDYTDPQYQSVSDVGPIPEADYYLPLTPTMPFDKSFAEGDAAGWGEGGWLLKERWWNRLGGRFGFFLHHDGGSRGTAGCIGVETGAVAKIQRLLIDAHNNGQAEVWIEVQYE